MIEFKSLSRTPNDSYQNSHYYCDYIELLALVDCDDGIGISEVYDRFSEDGRITGIGSDEGSSEYQKWMGRIENWFVELGGRIVHYGDAYPFYFDGNRLAKKEVFTEHEKVYVFLLLCSSLSYIQHYHVLTTIFEKLSYFAMKKYLPDIAEVHIFGVSKNQNDRYNGSLLEKFRILSNDLDLTLSNRHEVFRSGDNGDGGIDIIAWIPFKNDPNSDRKLIFMGQSASGGNWTNKQASVDRVKNYLVDLPDNSQNILFVPYDFRNFERKFCQGGEITASLVFDRYRMLNLIAHDDISNDMVYESFQSIMDYVCDFEEDII